MSDKSYLVTTYCFKGRDFLVKMNIFNRNTLDVKITDKITSETWHCSYDSSYVENLTHRTGNYKQFDIFTTMLKSGLLKTSESISLDLLTFDDLEALRSRRVMGRTCSPHSTNILPASSSNRRYLILTYTVEFDRIHYPLPMEYCGLPDPQVLQGTIRRMEQEISQLQEKLKNAEKQGCDEYMLEQVKVLEGRVSELTCENELLREEVVKLNNQLIKKQPPKKHTETLQRSLSALEEKFKREMHQLHHQVHRLKEEKVLLNSQLEEYKSTEKALRSQLHRAVSKKTCRQSRVDNFRRTSPYNAANHRTCVTTLKDKSPLREVLKKKNNNKSISPLPASKSDCPLTHDNRRNSSTSSIEKHHPWRSKSSPNRRRSCSSHRSSSHESLHSLGNRKTGINTRLKTTKFSIPDHSSSDSSVNAPEEWKTKTHHSKSKSRRLHPNKDLNNDVRIQDLEQRINSLQQLLETDFTVSARNAH